MPQATTTEPTSTPLDGPEMELLKANPALREEMKLLGEYLGARRLSHGDRILVMSLHIAFLTGLHGADLDDPNTNYGIEILGKYFGGDDG